MPSCQKFFEELGECLQKSACAKDHNIKPSKCLELLLRAKVHTQQTKEEQATGISRNLSAKSIQERQSDSANSPTAMIMNGVDPAAPMECAKAHQSYTECRIALMNPKSRFRGPYGG